MKIGNLLLWSFDKAFVVPVSWIWFHGTNGPKIQVVAVFHLYQLQPVLYLEIFLSKTILFLTLAEVLTYFFNAQHVSPNSSAPSLHGYICFATKKCRFSGSCWFGSKIFIFLHFYPTYDLLYQCRNLRLSKVFS